jgi:hypothetical protein
MGVGRSSDPDARAAGAAATAVALAGEHPKLLVVFCSESYDASGLLEGVESAAAGVPLIGCSTAGEIGTDGPGDAGVVVAAFGGQGFECTTCVADGVSGRLRDAGAEVAACAEEIHGREHRLLLLLSDGLAGDQQEIVRGAYDVLGASVPLVGGCAGDDLHMRRTLQLHGRETYENAVVAAGLGSDAPFGVGVRHGWRPVGEPVLVTESSGNRVYTLNEQPALDVYLERLNVPADARSEPEAFTRFASTHPLGLARHSEEPHVRFIGEADFEERSLGCIAAIPQGALAWFMEGNEDSVLDATDAACADALAPLAGTAPLGLLAFDCIARRGVLGDAGISNEIRRVAHHGSGAPVAGFYTYGEIARTSGVGGFHNQTLVVLAVA